MKSTPRNLPRWRAALALATLCVAPCQAADYSTTLSALDPVGYWPFNEATPSPALNTVSSATALGPSGTGYFIESLDGIDGTKGEPGVIGTSVRFYNAGNVVGYSGSKIDIPHTPALNPEPPFTIEFWAKPNTLGNDAFSPLSNLNSYFTGSNRSGWIFYASGAGGFWQFRVGGENSYTASPQSKNGSAVAGKWSHVVGVFDGQEARLYVDGALAATAAASASAPFKINNWVSMRIGSTALAGSDGFITWNHPFGNRQFDGWVDEVAVYASALSAERITTHFTTASAAPGDYGNVVLADNPVGYWKMDEPAFTDPAPVSFPSAANAGSAGADGDATSMYGVLAAQPGVPYSGFASDNRAVFFSGLNGNVAVGDLTNVAPPLNIVGEITLAAWIRPLQRDWYRQIITHGNSATGNATFLRIGPGSGALDSTFYEVGEYSGGAADIVASFPMPPGDRGNWVHLVGTFNGSTWDLYRNGMLVASTSDTVGAVEIPDYNWAIGADTDPNPGAIMGFGGYIDEPAVFARALTAAEVESLYLAANVPPVITRAPVEPAGAVFEGATVQFDVWAEGAPTLSYQWTRNGAPLPGQTATNLNLAGVTAGSSGTYGVVVTNPYGKVTNTVELVVLASPPTITQPPASLSRWNGQAFELAVVASGTEPIQYQWKRNGSPITGANAARYSDVASAATAGSYTVALQNSAGSTESTPAVVTVLPVPAGYGAAVLEDTPLAYWRLGEASGGVAHDYAGGFDGAFRQTTLGRPGFSAVDSDTAAAFSGTGSYVGAIDGRAINFEGNNNLTFTLEAWVNGTAVAGRVTTILAKGTGDSGGAANEQFALDVSEDGMFRFFVRDAGDNAYEAEAGVGPDGTWHHLVGVYDGPSGLLYLYVDGDVAASSTTPSAGVRASSFEVSIGSRRSGVAPEFDLTFEGTIDEVAIYNTALTPERIVAHYGASYGSNRAPFITGQPVAATNYVGLPTSLQVKAAGSVPLTYQWRKNGADIPGATASVLSFPSLAAADAGSYTVRIQNNVSSITSDPATVTVLPQPTTPPAISGLVLRLPFDNNLQDASGSGINGTRRGNPDYVTDGVVGSALHYYTDELGANYVTLGVHPELQLTANANLTVAFWIRLPVNYTGGDLPFFTDADGSTFGTGFVFAPSYGFDGTMGEGDVDGAWAFSVFDAAGAGTGGHGPIGSINDGGWHHLAYVLDRAAGTTVYLDGVPSPYTRQQGTTFGDAGTVSTGAPATIGQDPQGDYPERGSADIDELGVWRRALTPLEAASVYMAGVAKLGFENGQVAEVEVSVETTANGEVKLTWPSGTLQSADAVTGPFADLPATSPYLVTPTSPQKYYRVKL